MTATETLSRIHKISTGKADADVSAMSCCTKIAQLAYDVLPFSRGIEAKTLHAVYDIARANISAVSRMEAIAALCAQAHEKEAA